MKHNQLTIKKFIGIILFFVFFLGSLALYIRYTNTSIHLSTVMKQVDFKDFQWRIQIQTQGDAVNYSKKDFNFDLELNDSSIGLNREDYSIQVSEDGLFYNEEVSNFPTINSNVFEQDLYVHLADIWFDQHLLQNIYETNMHQTFKLLEPYTTHDSHQIDIVLTLEDLYQLSKAYVEMVSKESNSIAFDSCIQDRILKDYDTREVFEAYFKQLLDRTALKYHMDSPIQLHLYTKNNNITGFLFNLEMKYLNCDAVERIVVTGRK